MQTRVLSPGNYPGNVELKCLAVTSYKPFYNMHLLSLHPYYSSSSSRLLRKTTRTKMFQWRLTAKQTQNFVDAPWPSDADDDGNLNFDLSHRALTCSLSAAVHPSVEDAISVENLSVLYY
jgi:hypothetical protein